MNHKVGICGAGFVGSAVEIGLDGVADILIYDKYKDTDSLETVVNGSNVIFLCLPTPMSEDGSCDTSIIEAVAKEIDSLTDKPKALVVKSTVLPGTTKSLKKMFPRHCWIFNPEFLTEKNFINDFLNQDRIILGKTEPSTSQLFYAVKNLYLDFASFQKRPAKVVETDSDTAEMVKYTANCFLATKVMYFNEIHDICTKAGINYKDVVSLTTLDTRIGISHTSVPGPDGNVGFGGKCFPKDINGLICFAQEHGADPLLLESVWNKNLLIREEYDWENIPGAVSENMDFKK